jgi:hypothetical protein
VTAARAVVVNSLVCHATARVLSQKVCIVSPAIGGPVMADTEQANIINLLGEGTGVTVTVTAIIDLRIEEGGKSKITRVQSDINLWST